MSSTNTRWFRYALLFGLAMTEVLPIALLSQAIPVLMRRSGASMQQIGIVFLAMFPWSLKAVWAPLIDKLGARSRLGRYRGWLLLMHPLLLLTLLLGSCLDIPTLLLHHRAVAMAALIWLTSICALADAASHGLAVTLLSEQERGPGNGLQTAGLMVGHLVGGGLMVILVGSIGWQPALRIISALLLLPLPGIILYREPTVDPSRIITMTDVLAFFRRPRMGRWLLVVAAMPLGASLMAPVLDVLLVDRGFELKEIGLVMGVLASAAGVVGGIFGGQVVMRLGRQRGFYVLTFLCSVALAAVFASRFASTRPFLYFVIAIPSVFIMARATALHALMMDRSRYHMASTDFTIQYTIQQLSRFMSASVGSFMAGQLGATTVFVLAPLLTLAVLGFAAYVLERRDFQPTLVLPATDPVPDGDAAQSGSPEVPAPGALLGIAPPDTRSGIGVREVS